MVNKATLNTGIHISFQINVFLFFRYITSSGIAGSYGNSVFSFLRLPCIAFHSGFCNLHSYQLCTRVSFSPHPHQYLSYVDFLITAIMSVKVTQLSLILCDLMDATVHGILTGVGGCSLLQQFLQPRSPALQANSLLAERPGR